MGQHHQRNDAPVTAATRQSSCQLSFWHLGVRCLIEYVYPVSSIKIMWRLSRENQKRSQHESLPGHNTPLSQTPHSKHYTEELRRILCDPFYRFYLEESCEGKRWLHQIMEQRLKVHTDGCYLESWAVMHRVSGDRWRKSGGALAWVSLRTGAGDQLSKSDPWKLQTNNQRSQIIVMLH